MSTAERRQSRMRAYAERLLEGPMRRRNWSASLLEAVATALDRIVAEEIRLRLSAPTAGAELAAAIDSHTDEDPA